MSPGMAYNSLSNQGWPLTSDSPTFVLALQAYNIMSTFMWFWGLNPEFCALGKLQFQFAACLQACLPPSFLSFPSLLFLLWAGWGWFLLALSDISVLYRCLKMSRLILFKCSVRRNGWNNMYSYKDKIWGTRHPLLASVGTRDTSGTQAHTCGKRPYTVNEWISHITTIGKSR